MWNKGIAQIYFYERGGGEEVSGEREMKWIMDCHIINVLSL